MTTESLLAILVLWVIKPLLIIMLVLLGAMFLRRTSAALQHFWLANGVVAVFLLLALSPFIPDIEWQVLPAANSEQLHPIFVWWYELLALLSDTKILSVLVSVYVFGASTLLIYFLLGLSQLHTQTRLASNCNDAELNSLLQQLRSELDIDRPVKLLVSGSVHAPQMWGFLRPVITLPVNAKNWSSERKLSVLIHELGHVARFDWLLTVVVKIVCALIWFLPPVWWLAARLDHCAEMACDDFIYRLRDKHLAYAESLLSFAAPNIKETTPALPMAGHAPIFYRIQAILDQRRPHTPVTAEAQQYWVLTFFMLLLPLAGLQLIPIREMLLVKLLVIQSEELEPDSIHSETQLISTPSAPVDNKTLQQLLVRELPPARTHEMETIHVKATPTELIHPVEFAMMETQLNVAKPMIRIEGHAPLRTVIPVYPRQALQQAIEGEVVVRFTISTDGSVADPEILEAQPRRIFDKAVLSAIRDWQYRPQIIDGRPVVVQGVIEKFTFQLEPHGADKRRR